MLPMKNPPPMNAAMQFAAWLRRNHPAMAREMFNRGLLPIPKILPTSALSPLPVEAPEGTAMARGIYGKSVPAAPGKSFMGNYLPLNNRGVISPFEKFKVNRGEPSPNGGNLKGLGQAMEFNMTGDSYGYTTNPAPAPTTDWGQLIFGAGQAFLQTQQQHDLMKLNLARAEKGLPPIEASSIAPQVNVGVSGDVQKLIGIGIGLAAIVALAAVFRKG